MSNLEWTPERPFDVYCKSPEREVEWEALLQTLEHAEQEFIETHGIGPRSVIFEEAYPHGLIIVPYNDPLDNYAFRNEQGHIHFNYLLNVRVVVVCDVDDYETTCERPDIKKYQEFKKRWEATTKRWK